MNSVAPEASGTGFAPLSLGRLVRNGPALAVRRIRHRRATARQLRLRSPGEPPPIFRPGTGGWYVEFGERWFRPWSQADIDALITLLPLEVLDEQILTSVRSTGGSVRVVELDSSTELEFISSLGDVVRRAIGHLGDSAAVATWESGAHPDGWVETNARLRLDGVRRCAMTVFLPDLPSANTEPPPGGDKELAVHATVGRHTDVDIHHIRRDQPTRIDLLAGRSPVHGLILDLQTSAPEPIDDARQLGFVVVRIEAFG